MKIFLRIFSISIISSGIILTITYLLSFTPLDSKNGSFFSNGFIIGFILLIVGIFRIRPKGDSHNNVLSHEQAMLGGVKQNPKNSYTGSSRKISLITNPDAIAFILSGLILLILSFIF